MKTKKRQYIIDWVYADNSQMFSTNAELSQLEASKLQDVLDTLEDDGEVICPCLYERPDFVPQTYRQVMTEIENAIGRRLEKK